MEKHTHKYQRIKIGKNKRVEFKCAIPGCVHHIIPELVLGRPSICWNCGDEFIITKYNIKAHAKPKCLKCQKGKENITNLIAILGE